MGYTLVKTINKQTSSIGAFQTSETVEKRAGRDVISESQTLRDWEMSLPDTTTSEARGHVLVLETPPSEMGDRVQETSVGQQKHALEQNHISNLEEAEILDQVKYLRKRKILSAVHSALHSNTCNINKGAPFTLHGSKYMYFPNIIISHIFQRNFV